MAAPDTRREVTLQADNFEVSVGDDDEHRGVKLGIDNEPFWRVWLTPQGEILTGNGMVPPTTYAGGGGGGGGTVNSVVAGTGISVDATDPANPIVSFAVDMATQSELDGETTARGIAIAALSAVYQPLHANLTAFAGLSLVADRLPYANGTGTLALATFTAAGRALVDDADAAAQRTTLGLGTLATQSWPLANTGATAATDAVTLDVTGDTQKRLVINQDGSMEWGSGAAVADATLSRSAARTLGLAGSLALTIQNAADIGLLVKGAGSQSGNLQEWQNSAGSTLMRLSAGGTLTSAGGAAFGAASAGGSTHVLLTPTGGTDVVLKILAFSGQTANLQEWQDSAGAAKTVALASGQLQVANNGYFYGKTTGGLPVPLCGIDNTNTLSFAPSIGSVNFTTFGAGLFVINGIGQFAVGLGSIANYSSKFSVKGSTTTHTVAKFLAAASQTASIMEWQDSAGAVLASVSAAGLGLFAGLSITDAKDITFGTTTGTKIGTGTTQKIGLWNATPAVQPAAVADATGGTVIDTEARAAINALLARLRTPGFIAT